MSRPSLRRSALLAVATVAATLTLGGCQIVSRVVMADPAETPSTLPPVETCVLLRVTPPADGSDPTLALEATAGVITARLQGLGVGFMQTTTTAPDSLVVSLPSGDSERWRSLIERPGQVTFVPVPPEFNQQISDGQPLPAGMDPTPVFDSSGLSSASLSEDQLGKPAIALTLDEDAAAAFDAFAAAHYGERFAIVMDGIVLSSPSINATEFNGQAQISGDFSVDGALDMVTIIATGPLPAVVTEVGTGAPVDGECPDTISAA